MADGSQVSMTVAHVEEDLELEEKCDPNDRVSWFMYGEVQASGDEVLMTI